MAARREDRSLLSHRFQRAAVLDDRTPARLRSQSAAARLSRPDWTVACRRQPATAGEAEAVDVHHQGHRDVLGAARNRATDESSVLVALVREVPKLRLPQLA